MLPRMENETPDIAAMMNDVFNPGPQRLSGASDAGDDNELDVPANAPPEVWQLRETQRQVLSAIMGGNGYTFAARAGGVSRRTVYNWAKDDAAFKAAMSAWQDRM